MGSVRTDVLPGLLQTVPADIAIWRQISPPPPVLLSFPDNTLSPVPNANCPWWDAARSLTVEIRDENCLVLLSLARYDQSFAEAEATMLAGLTPFLRRRVRRLVADTSGLSPRERQVMDLVGQGLTGGAVARRLGCRPRTVDKHLEHIYRKLGVSGRMSAVRSWSRDPPAG